MTIYINNTKSSDINIKSIDTTPTKAITASEIMKAAETGFVNGFIDSNLALRPKLIINDHNNGTKVLSDITSELTKCKEFMLCVAFITSSGITPLLETLRYLEKNNIKGRIITTNYLNFSEPKALKKLLSFKNLSLKMYCKDNFHTKGYIFKHEDYYKVIVGSSNLTQSALTKNKEWNITVSSLEEGALTESVLKEFEIMWKDAENLTSDLIDTYENIYKKQREYTKKSIIPRITQYKLKPNKMQVAAINSLTKLRESGLNKALIISATGTGKTYLSAFDVRNFNPRRALFVVHREQIAKQALNSFSNVFGDTRSMGILSGTSKALDKDFIFSTIQTLSKDEVLTSFPMDEFDYIIIDEVHKAGSNSYQKLVNYFQPKFLLGMSATPERSDDFDIFKMFDYNIAYEIRLQHALEEDLLCPFHYFGITDVSADGHELSDTSDFKYLIAEERVNHIIEKLNYYGYCGDRVKGLIFCSNKEEAKNLSEKFNERGFNTLALTGDNSQKDRDEAISRLEQDERSGSLDYIFTVDIFNEGVDIPAVNQVVMLRATKSAIVFVQQLGRGLRKAEAKEFVVIIDFVGNYDNNFLIPIALSGDNTYNKDNIRKYVLEGNRTIPGCSTVNFDEISKKRIFESIDRVKFNKVAFIKENYTKLKQKLGKIPTLMDFDTYDAMDPLIIFDNGSLGSYHMFLKKHDKDYDLSLTPLGETFIEFISKKLAAGKRIHELELLKYAMNNSHGLMKGLKGILKEKYNIAFTENTETSIVNILNNEFPSGAAKNTYNDCIFLEEDGDDYKVSNIFQECLNDENFRLALMDLLDFGIYRYNKNYGVRYGDTSFQLYQKYTYEDVCRLLEWEKGEVALNIGGYKFDKTTKTFPVFINYDKSGDINDTINYHDRFISNSQLIAISKSGRTVDSTDVKQIYNAEADGVSMNLFVRKNKDDDISKEFYYLGKIKAVGSPHEFTMKNTTKTAVEITYELYTPIREDLYEYLTS